MSFSKFAASLPGLLLLLAGFPGNAEDNTTSDQSLNATQNELFALANNSPRSSLSALTSPFSYPEASSGVLHLGSLQPDGPSLTDVDGDVCYTMRSYKVKRTERLADKESGRRGYSRCEMASSYHLRSAHRQARKQR